MSVIHTPRKPQLDARLLCFPLAMLALLVVLFFRLWYFQVVKAPELVERADATRTDKVLRPAPRGLIFDRHGQLIAGLKPQIVITGVYDTISKNPSVIAKLAEILGVDEKRLKPKIDAIRHSPGLAVPIWVGTTPQIGTKIAEEANELPGIGVDLEPTRYYPDATSFAHLLGYVGLPNEKDIKRIKALGKEPSQFVGKGGIEQRYETDLMGQPGDEVVDIDAKRRPLRVVARDNPIPGRELMLTLSAKLQRSVAAIMEQDHYVGGVVALDPRTGEILCLVSGPTFDQSEFEGGISTAAWDNLIANPDHPLIKRFMQASYPPGSTFKIVTSLASYEAGTFDTHREVDCQGGFRLGHAFFRCEGHHGDISYHYALVRSCNTYFADLGFRTGPKALLRACNEAGLGQPTGIDIGGEHMGVVPTDAWMHKAFKNPQWHGGDTVNMAIGQGFLQVTPLQMADVACMVANQGVIYKPHLVRQVLTDERAKGDIVQPEVIHKVDASPQFWQTVKSAMEGVIQEGTAVRSQIPGLVWAGKTGSAENGAKSKKKKTHSWFIGFAPADDPKIAFCVLVENSGQGADFAAPLAKQLVQTYLAESAPAKAPVITGPSASISAAKVGSPKPR